MLIYVFKVGNEWHRDVNDQDVRKLDANGEQIHSALSQNGWVRINRFAEDDGVTGHYTHSANWPLDEQQDPLKEFYADESQVA